ncbi:MAG: four helix bundle protein [Verrucomicrobiota bacterium]
MKEENVILEKSYAFALEIMILAKAIRERREFDLASQLWRAGTSIGANVEEAQAAQSRADFRSKMSIAAKEARETHYWLRLTRDGNILDAVAVIPLITEIGAIKRILTSIVKSAAPDGRNSGC